MRRWLLVLIVMGSLSSALLGEDLPGKDLLGEEKKTQSNFNQDAWSRLAPQEEAQVEALAQEYKDFLQTARHELLAVAETVRLARAQGFRPVSEIKRVKPGDRVYAINRDRGVIFAVIGRKPMTDGALLVGAHIDSPRLELKANPLYAKEGVALFQTDYHGGIKKYQWASIPLALVGRVNKKDGTMVKIRFGLEGEPYLAIPDLAPHLDVPLRERTQREVFKGEELDPIVGTRPDENGSVVGTVQTILREKYGIGPEDFVSAQLALVPALPPADVGFDRSLVGAYGHDDLLCSFAGFRSLLDIRSPERTAMVYLVPNEETGSQNVIGAQGTFLADTVLDLLEKESGRVATLRMHRQALSSMQALSADVAHALHPMFPEVKEKTNTARLGSGVVMKIFGHGHDATSEVRARVRALLDANDIPWQINAYKVDVGGGGTIAGFLSDDGMDAIDVGIPMLSMHATWSFASKVDLWWFYRFLIEFYSSE